MITKIICPKGYRFRVVDTFDDGNEIRVSLLKNNSRVGYVQLLRARARIYETHSLLDVKYRGKGLGALLYSKAIQWCLDRKYKVRSSGGTSEMAIRVWEGKTLRKHFKIVTKSDTYGNTLWHAHPKSNERKTKKTTGRNFSRRK